MLNETEIRKAIISIIESIGEDPNREGLRDTPRRVAEMYNELFMGIEQDPKEVLSVEFEEGHREMVIVRDIPFYSLCEHHLLPFYGTAHIGYIPNAKGRVVGASKLPRVVDIFARRLQIQERMTSQIADAIVEGIEPAGVGVVVRAEHLCMMMRGVRKPGSTVETSALRGTFRSNSKTRSEFITLLQTK
ncbi:GTP cyclohydrolase I FolE [Chloroflexota bacterium]